MIVSMSLRASLERILASPTADELWSLQKELLVAGGADAARAREVAKAFHLCLMTLESKAASRSASRWGAALGTAAVASVSLRDILARQDTGLGELLELTLPAALEVGASVKSAEAWEIEAGHVYDEFAWLLYEQLWNISLDARPELTSDERRERIDGVIDPLLDPALPHHDRATLVVDMFRSVLAARVLPLLDER
jgi:hypothetical protein